MTMHFIQEDENTTYNKNPIKSQGYALLLLSLKIDKPHQNARSQLDSRYIHTDTFDLALNQDFL